VPKTLAKEALKEGVNQDACFCAPRHGLERVKRIYIQGSQRRCVVPSQGGEGENVRGRSGRHFGEFGNGRRYWLFEHSHGGCLDELLDRRVGNVSKGR